MKRNELTTQEKKELSQFMSNHKAYIQVYTSKNGVKKQ